MRICVDENVKRSIATLLEQEGYDVVRVQDERELGFEDESIVAENRAGSSSQTTTISSHSTITRRVLPG